MIRTGFAISPRICRKAADSIVNDGINLAASNRAMDFGKGGFYVTNNPRQAMEWASQLADKKGGAMHSYEMVEGPC
ncbi:DUF3990 domain-containing protein [Streptomyces sp. NPDC058471]|uniref:DUF3990 domain-containing protein n=1 Tax=Streptomyces sp. NPDC058471 TaxID=3346516 RepID=UPI0036605F82